MNQKKTLNELSTKYGVSRPTIKKWAEVAGIDKATTIFDEAEQERIAQVKRLRDEGRSLEEIRNLLGFSTNVDEATSLENDPFAEIILTHGIKPAVKAVIPLIPQAVAEVITENLEDLKLAFANFRQMRTVELLEEDDSDLPQLLPADSTEEEASNDV